VYFRSNFQEGIPHKGRGHEKDFLPNEGEGITKQNMKTTLETLAGLLVLSALFAIFAIYLFA